MNIGLLAHLTGNIGHNFMALGVEAIVRLTFDNVPIKITFFEQHQPWQIYPWYHPVRLLNNFSPGTGVTWKKLTLRPKLMPYLWSTISSQAKKLDLAISCGGPNISIDVAKSTDMAIMLNHMQGAFSHWGVPVANLSNGSCYPYEQLPIDHVPDPSDEQFLRQMLATATITTVRNSLAQQLTRSVGYDCPLIPCPALLSNYKFAADINRERQNSTDRFLVLNIQEKGSNDDWGQNVDAQQWQQVVRELITRLRPRHQLVFVCHNEKEYRLANTIDPSLPRYQPKTPAEYFKLIARAEGGLCNRIHAAIALASIGVPAVGVGTDSRLQTLEAIGLKTWYVKNVNAEQLEQAIEDNWRHRAEEAERLRILQQETLRAYQQVLRTLVG